MLSLAALACNLSSPSPQQPEDAIPTLGTLYNTRVPTLIPDTLTPSNTPTDTPVPPTDTPIPSDTPVASDTPPPTDTSVPPTQAPAAPAPQPTSPPEPTSEPVHPSAGEPFSAWFHIESTRMDADSNKAWHVIYLSARGGSGIYRYYANGQSIDGPTYEVESTLCGGFVAGSARVEDTAGNSEDIQVGFNAFCPTPFGCNNCELWSP
jgi:hypothetical protein